jgi:hypothetical protein
VKPRTEKTLATAIPMPGPEPRITSVLPGIFKYSRMVESDDDECFHVLAWVVVAGWVLCCQLLSFFPYL